MQNCLRTFQGFALLAVALLLAKTSFAQPSLRSSSSQVARLLESTEWIRTVDEEALVALVPTQSGLNFVGCPNCQGGRQEGQLAWTIERPNEVHCRYCNHVFPSDKYSMSQSVEVNTPNGKKASFLYWADSSGYRYFFEAKRHDAVKEYLAEATYELARLYSATKDEAQAHRVALILDRFAQVFPDWCFHYDYPFQQKQIYDGPVAPDKFRRGYRTARWSWWAYKDIPLELVHAYELTRGSSAYDKLSQTRGVDVRARIERDLIRNACDQVVANPETASNMSPTAWRGMITVGRVLNEPKYVHDVVRRIRTLIDSQFFYDGMWSEGSPDYASQTVGGLQEVVRLLKGYSDPAGYTDPIDGQHFENLNLDTEFPLLQTAREALAKMRLPDGRTVPVHDTWSTSRRGSTDVTQPYLLPALGHACLGGGAGDQQTQFHLTWSGAYGHSHADNLSLLLFANGREALSDLGYTHTAYRSWTLASAAHNLVVIDGVNQYHSDRDGASDGRLRWCDTSDPNSNDPTVQWVRADGARGYPKLARKYERTLCVVRTDEDGYYAVDYFDVEGGSVHDYFLHGDADGASKMDCALPMEKVDSLLPAGMKWSPTKNEGESGKSATQHWAYGFLNQLKGAKLQSTQPVQVATRLDAQDSNGVDVWLMPESDSELFLGQNPSIRGANEDDSRLDQFQRPFMMLRHRPTNGRSQFAAVIQPQNGTTQKIQSVERLQTPEGGSVVLVRFARHTDVIGFDVNEVLSFKVDSQSVSFRGQLGVLRIKNGSSVYASLAGDGAWVCGSFTLNGKPSSSATLVAVDRNEFTVAGANLTVPERGSIVTLNTADDWVYPLMVRSVEQTNDQLKIEFAEGANFQFDVVAKQLKLKSFPQRSHSGDVRLQWTPRTK